MNAAAWIAVVAVVVTLGIAVMTHVVASFFWAGRVTEKLDSMARSQGELKSKVDQFTGSCFTKAEAANDLSDAKKEHAALWRRVDRMKLVIVKLGGKVDEFEDHGRDVA